MRSLMEKVKGSVRKEENAGLLTMSISDNVKKGKKKTLLLVGL